MNEMNHLTGKANTVTLHQAIAASPARVWRVLVDPAQIPRWMGGFQIETTWSAGGPWVISGTLLGKPHREVGMLLDVQTGQHLQFSHWSRLWRVDRQPQNYALMTVTLTADGAGTIVTTVHELPDVLAIAEHARFFWQGALFRLGALAEQSAMPQCD